MSNAGHEPDKLWGLITELKRSPARRPGLSSVSDRYCHDPKQTWVQVVLASRRAGNRPPLGRQAARRRLKTAILRGSRAVYRGALPLGRSAAAYRVKAGARALIVLAIGVLGLTFVLLCRAITR